MVYSTGGRLSEMSASLPLVVNNDLIFKYPSAVQQSEALWLFCSAYDQNQQHWNIQYRLRIDAQWSAIGPAEPDPSVDIALNPFAVAGVYDPVPQRRNAYASVDGDNRLWLFWIENDGSGWRLRYNRRDGNVWGPAVDLPNAGMDSVVFDLSVIIQPGLPDQRLYLFWAHQAETSTSGQIRWEVSYRVKQDLNLDDANWSGAQSLPKDAGNDDHHDREPYPVLSGINIELFWSSNREDSGWSLWHNILTDHADNLPCRNVAGYQYFAREGFMSSLASSSGSSHDSTEVRR